ncbi:MAG: flavin reductase [Planctomycetes bacterium]|nr:flavin reductase [Planctomycetota bacterium]
MKVPEESKQLYAALGRVPSGLFVLTIARSDVETGMLASWVQQCSFEPPLLSVAIQRGRDISALLTAGAVFTLNILDDSQTDMIAHFGKGPAKGEPIFNGLEVLRGEGSGPVLNEALGFVNCVVTGKFPAGDHDLVIAQVIAGRLLNDGQPMVHVRKSASHY